MRREDLEQPWKIKNLRTIAMLPAGDPRGLSREDALLVLEFLAERTAPLPAPLELPGNS